MTSTTRPSIPPSARARRTYTWLLALAVGPGLVAVSCSDDAEPDTLGTGGTAGSSSTVTAGSGGSSSGGSAGAAAGAGGAGGSAGASSAAGSGGNAGNTGVAGTVGLPEDGPDASTTAAFTLTSPAFDGVAGCGPDGDAPDLCDLFPEENTGLNGADNVSPQLDWTGAPAGTQSFAIVFHDLSDPFTHWVMWNIPASANGLPAELPKGTEPGVPDANARQVSYLNDDPDDANNNGFAGSGAAGNVYEFVLYALNTASIDPGTENPGDVEAFIADLDDETLGTTTLRARSEP